MTGEMRYKMTMLMILSASPMVDIPNVQNIMAETTIAITY